MVCFESRAVSRFKMNPGLYYCCAILLYESVTVQIFGVQILMRVIMYVRVIAWFVIRGNVLIRVPEQNDVD